MMKDIGFSVTTAVDSYSADSAAGATAMATGHKTNNRYMGVDSRGRTLPSEKLKNKGFRTAIISTLLIVTADLETGGLSLLGGDISKGYVQGNFSTNDHTTVMVSVFAYGPGSENFRGVYQKTQRHFKILDLLFEKQHK